MEEDLVFIRPKNLKKTKVDWEISEQVQAIVRYYAQYTECIEEEVVDKFLKNILRDKDFIKWVETRRHNKRITKQIFDAKDLEGKDIG